MTAIKKIRIKNFKSFKEFLSFFENKYSEVIGSMGVRDIKICDYP